MTTSSIAPASLARQRPPRRVALWGALLLLLLVALSLLVALTVRHEAARAQDQVDRLAAEAAAQVRAELLNAQRRLQALALQPAGAPAWQADAATPGE